MKAIFRTNVTSLVDIQLPRLDDEYSILIKVKIAGLCRTDVYMAQRDFENGIILGHEFSGVIEKIYNEKSGFEIGDKVGVMPFFNDNSNNKIMLGTNVHGAFAEYIRVPASVVYKLPDHISFEEGAYLEPIAASLAATKAPITHEMRGLILGKNRIADLTKRVMNIRGYSNLEVVSENDNSSYDYVIETIATEEVLEKSIDLLKPNGILVMKSRPLKSIPIPVNKIVQKEIKIFGVNYADFADGISLLASKELDLTDLFGETFSLDDGVKILTGEKKVSEEKKIFFRP